MRGLIHATLIAFACAGDVVEDSSQFHALALLQLHAHVLRVDERELNETRHLANTSLGKARIALSADRPVRTRVYSTRDRSATKATGEAAPTANMTRNAHSTRDRRATGEASPTANMTRNGNHDKYYEFGGGTTSHGSLPQKIEAYKDWLAECAEPSGARSASSVHYGIRVHSSQDWLAAFALAAFSTIITAVIIFPCGPESTILRTCKLTDAMADSSKAAHSVDRPRYCISQEGRPLYRGMLVGWFMWRWPFMVALQFLVCFFLPFGHSFPLLLGRLLTGVATSGSIFLSDRYHNGDKRGDWPDDELYWLRWDITFVSFILSGTFQLWVAHFEYRMPPMMVDVRENFNMLVICNWVVSLCVLGTSHLFLNVKANKSPSILALLSFQYVPVFGYMVWIACNADFFWRQTSIWFIYLPGILCYASCWPADTPEFGYHDVFHVFVVCGHLSSMIWDIYTSAWIPYFV